MIEQSQLDKIKEAAEEFFEKMTIPVSGVDASVSSADASAGDKQDLAVESGEVVNLDVKLEEPQILIGQGGQTLFEIQRLLRTILNKKLSPEKSFYFNLDINDYKKKKIEYLKDLAKTLADQVSLAKEEKSLQPMSSYERRIIHAELSQRTDIMTESRGDGLDRHVVIKPK